MTVSVSSSPSDDGTRGPLISHSPGFIAWLAAADASLAFTTYQAGRLFLVGRRGDRLALHERLIEQCKGLWADGRGLWVSATHALWRFDDVLVPGETTAEGADRLYAPREARITGDLDIHDLALGIVDGTRKPIFAATGWNCLATVSEHASFRPLWRPSFVSALVAEDRCHLNGLALEGGRATYATTVATSDDAGGWRARRVDGGVVIDVASGETAIAGLSMPHSPRLHGGQLWGLDSGRGDLVRLDTAQGRREPVGFCPGFARGLAFAGRFAVVGLSRPRRSARNAGTFDGLALDGRLAAAGEVARCGLMVFDLESGRPVEWLTIEHTIQELYDVAVLPGVRCPEAVGFLGTDIATLVRPEA